MNTLPAAFEERMKNQLGGEAEAFFNALQTPPPVSIRLNPGKLHSPDGLFTATQALRQVDWCENAYYLSQRPVFTLDPCLHGGGYYVQEASSMFLRHILKQIMPSGPVRILDLCAAPGGKSTLIASLLSPDSLLVANEVIRSRASILKENIIKWGQDNIIVTNNDPADFQDQEGAFDIILVDAPCSGEGMFRKDKKAIREWNENNLCLCKERQQRILTNIRDCLKPGGLLIYSTCTYNPGENEEMLDWLIKEYPAQSVRIEHSFSDITPGNSKAHSYHFYPHKTKGEGFFVGVIQKLEGKEFIFRKNKKPDTVKPVLLPDNIRQLISQPERYSVYPAETFCGIIPAIHADFVNHLNHSLRILYKGCEVAELNNRKIKLLPAFALWQGLNKANCSVYDADRNTALTYLKKEDISAAGLSGDWLLISHRNIGLGWCKNLGNRLNNYYPKEWRIRMQLDSVPESNCMNEE